MHQQWIKRVARLTSALLLAFGVALAATAATPTSICACNFKEKMYLTNMRAELRNLITSQEAFFADSGRFATSASELIPARHALAPGIEIVSFAAWGNSFEVRVRAAGDTTRECWISSGPARDGTLNAAEGEPVCDPPPLAAGRVYVALAYALLILTAVLVRFARAGAALPPVSGGVLTAFLLVGVVHPFWTGYRSEGGGCTLGVGIEWISLCLAASFALWMIVRRREEWRAERPA